MSVIRKTRNGNYQADVLNKDGNRIRRVFSKRQEAQVFCVNMEKEKNEMRLYRNGITKKPVTISSAVEEALKSKLPLAEKSYSKYKCVFNIFEEFVADRGITHLREFTAEHADEFRDVLTSSEASAKTVNFYILAVRALLRDYVLKGALSNNPFDHIKLERVKNKTLLERDQDYYSAEELRSFFSQEMGKKQRIAFKALLFTGMRFGELSNLTWERIAWENKMIQVRTTSDFTTKTESSERDIPISNQLYLILEDLKKTSVSGYVFCREDDSKLRERKLLSDCKSIAKKAGITKNATLHKFRHSFNSHLAQSGVDYSLRQYLMGHKPQTMTDRYTKVDPKKLHDTVSLLDKLLPE